MAEDLGTWPPEQATVLVEVLQKAGIPPKARRTREGIEVTVEDEHSDQAHATLVANMDTIARAARTSLGEGAGRRRASRGPARQRPRDAAAERTSSERPLASQRLVRLARPLGILIVALLVGAVVPPLRIPLLIGAIALIIWLLGRESDDESGP